MTQKLFEGVFFVLGGNQEGTEFLLWADRLRNRKRWQRWPGEYKPLLPPKGIFTILGNFGLVQRRKPGVTLTWSRSSSANSSWLRYGSFIKWDQGTNQYDRVCRKMSRLKDSINFYLFLVTYSFEKAMKAKMLLFRKCLSSNGSDFTESVGTNPWRPSLHPWQVQRSSSRILALGKPQQCWRTLLVVDRGDHEPSCSLQNA